MAKTKTKPKPDDAYGLDARQVDAAELLVAAELPVAEIAEKVGVSRRTLSRWRQVPGMVAMMADFRADAIAGAQSVLTAAVEKAARKLVGLLDADDTRGLPVKLQACREILNRVCGDPSKPETNITQSVGPAENIRDFESLPPALREEIARASGGPPE